MAAAGITVRYPLERYSVLGVAEILRKIPAHALLLRRLRRGLRAGSYDLVVLIDYPGFNVRLGETARRAGAKVLYFIPPKPWAARTTQRRLRRLARCADRFAVILPFEAAFFARHAITAEYVGHPLLDAPAPPSRAAARARLGIPASQRVLAVFPGSRTQELRLLWGPLSGAARLLLERRACDRVVVAAVAGGHYPNAEGMLLHAEDPATILAAADAALVKSGTATLEAALAEVPMVVTYRVHPVTAWLARRLLAVRWISLVNLLAEREVVPELLQDQLTPERLAAALQPLLARESPEAVNQRAAFAALRSRLGGPGAIARTADLAAELLG